MKEHVYHCTRETTDHLDNVIGTWELRVTYTYSPQRRAPVVRSEGRVMDPDDPEELEIIKIEEELSGHPGAYIPVDGGGWLPEPMTWFDWHKDWLMDEHYDAMVENAVDDEPDPDYAYEEYRDRMMED